MFFASLAGLLGMAAWESHTTSKENIYKKHPEIARQNAEKKALYAKINKRHIDTVRSMGYEIADDYEVVHYCGD